MTDGYARGWRHAWWGFAVVTLCVASVMWSVSAVLLLTVTLTVLTALITGLVRSGTGRDEEVLAPRALLSDGLRWGVLGVAVIATGMLQGGLGFLLVVAIVLTSPLVVRLFLGLGHSGPRSAAADVEAALHAVDMRRAREVVDRLDLAGLCWAWNHSAQLLVEVPDARARATVVALREIYLDEMERRHPQGFAAWLESGVDASSSPEPFLAGPPEEHRGGGLAA